MNPDQKKIVDRLQEACSRVDPLLADIVGADDLSPFTHELEIAEFPNLCDFAEDQANLRKASAREQPVKHHPPAPAGPAQDLFQRYLQGESSFLQKESSVYRAMSDVHSAEQDRLTEVGGNLVEVGSHAALGRLCKRIADEASNFANSCTIASGR